MLRKKYFRLCIYLFLVLPATAIGTITLMGALYRPDAGVIPAGYPGKMIVLDGRAIRVEQAGAGSDVLLIHGQGGSLEDFDPIFDALAAGYRVTRYDRPSHGFSAAAGEHDFETGAAFAAALVERMDIREPIIVGHSFGGGIALALALDPRVRARGLMLLASVGYPCGTVRCAKPDLFEAAARRLLVIPGFGTGLAMLLSRTVATDLAMDHARSVFAPDPLPDRAQLDRLATCPHSPACIVAVYEQERIYERSISALAKRYGSLRTPTILFQGRRDRFPDLIETAGRLQRDIPGSTLHWLEGSGHMVQFAQPERVIAAVDQLARGVHR